MSSSTRKRVAVLRGGPSDEYDISMQTGAGVLQALQNTGFIAKDIIISRNGQWLSRGYVQSPEQALIDSDVVFIALHGAYGEDGTVQRTLERLSIPYTGSNSFASAIAMNKVLTKEFVKQRSKVVKMAPHLKVSKENVANIYQTAESIQSLFGPEYVIKPIAGGSSIGTIMTTGALLSSALQKALETHDEVIVEKRINGKEATVGILEHFRNELLYRLPVIEIVPPTKTDFFSAEVKYTGETEEICPGRFSDSEKEALMEAAQIVHTALELRQYSRSDFIVADDGVYFLEVNTLPGLTPHSLFPKAMDAVGSSYKELISHLIAHA
jgi:D-alanine-D-alanine ligase